MRYLSSNSCCKAKTGVKSILFILVQEPIHGQPPVGFRSKDKIEADGDNWRVRQSVGDCLRQLRQEREPFFIIDSSG